MPQAYQAALEKARAASREFMKAQTDYRAGKISDAEFLAAKALYTASDVEFDAAYAAEQARAV